MSQTPQENINKEYGSGSNYAYSKEVTSTLQSRTVHKDAAFILPFIKAGMKILDFGCGPGSITITLAELLAPHNGQIVGIDIARNQIDAANALLEKQAQELKPIVTFSQGSVYDLNTCQDQQFDMVFGNAVMYHLADKEKAISELKRVLKPNGLIAIRDSYDAATIVQPILPRHQAMLNVLTKFGALSGGDNDFGIKQPQFLREHGFEVLSRSASFEMVDLSMLKSVEFTKKVLYDAKFQKAALDLGFVKSATEFEEFEQGAMEWSNHPDAFIARARMECVAKML